MPLLWGMTLTLVVIMWCSQCEGQTNNSLVNGSIVWGQLASDQDYRTEGYAADNGGLDPYFDLARNFIETSLPEKLPVGTVKDILDGKASIGDSWQDLAKQFWGFTTCLLLGILFIIIFPIVGCCFCCCRCCCGQCGGKAVHNQSSSDKCKRLGFSTALFVLAIFVLAGAGCMLASSNQVHSNLDGLNQSSSDAMEDFNTFVNNIHRQFRHLGDTNFGFLTDVVIEYVDTASDKLAINIMDVINDAVNLNGPLDNIGNLQDTAQSQISDLKTQVDTLEGQRDDALTELSTIHSSCNCLGASITHLNNMDAALNTLRTEISTFEDQVSSGVLQELQTDLNNSISSTVTDQTNQLDVSKELGDISTNQIEGILDKVDDFKDDLKEKTSKFHDHVEEWLDRIYPYDTYRWYAGVGLSALMGLLALMLIAGLLLGNCCSSAHDRPTERSSAANCGGLCLMAVVGMVFILGAVLMLLCTLMYVFGSLTERYFCQSIDHLDRVEEYANSFDLGTDLGNISFTVNDDTIVISIHQVMTDCKAQKTLYTALGLQQVVDTAIKEIGDYKENLDVINDINPEQAANSTQGNVNADEAVGQLQNSTDSIDAVKTSVTAMKTELQTEQTNANALSTGSGQYYDAMIATLGDMETTCDSLEITAQDLSDAATNLNSNELPAAVTKLDDPSFMESLIENVTGDFADTIFGHVDSYTSDFQSKLQNDVGICTPFYSITNAIFGEAVCHGIVDPLNGFWLALGWCLFFLLPSMVLSVKLARHFRTMQYEDVYDSTTGSSPPPPYFRELTAGSTKPAKPPKHTSLFPPLSGPHNKVAPF